MQHMTEEKYRKMAELVSIGAPADRIAKRLGVGKRTAEEFIDGQTPNPIGMAVFEETTRPSGITKEQHEAWLAQNGYRGFAEAARKAAHGRTSQPSEPQ